VIPFLLVILLAPLLLTLGMALFSNWGRRGGVLKAGLFIGILAVLAVTVSAMFYAIGRINGGDTCEILDHRIVKMIHEERWSTLETRIVRERIGKDSNGRARYRNRTETYVAHHGPYWHAVDSKGARHTAVSSDWDRWKSPWAPVKRVGTHAGINSGGIFEIAWPGSDETIFSLSSFSTYENRIRGSDSIFSRSKPSKELKARFPRPADRKDSRPIFDHGHPYSQADESAMRRAAGKLAPEHRLHSIVMLFDASKDSSEVADEVMKAWDGPNLNELVICVGIDKPSGKVSWCEVRSWLDNPELHPLIRDGLLDKPWSGETLAKILVAEVPMHWKKKSSKDFQYLSIPVNPAWSLFALALLMVLSLPVAFFINSLDPGGARIR
jgi:hypothetical protein